MAREGRGGTTRTEGIYRTLRSDILGGRLVPGERLKFPDLCERYNTSVGAAREALTRLKGEGFVKAQPRQGYMVTPLSHSDLADLTEARTEIEPLVLRLSVEQGDMRWESDAVAAHHMLERTPFFAEGEQGGISDDWTEAHAAFHLALIAACRNRRLLDTAKAMREEAELYRQWSVSFGQEPHRDLAGEHRALLDAAVSRDGDLAARLLRDHISHTTRLLITCAVDEPNTEQGSPARE
ncbi:GntR family transcriptional regulator [Streptomyces sp. LE64]|jgi:DNA-binding GntR family transcriptional regulator|uniref:GntR family transcriptional regulator n=1 Tax=Streptomyces sp. LE64 TaxID=3448653 RepID=UPI0040425586